MAVLAVVYEQGGIPLPSVAPEAPSGSSAGIVGYATVTDGDTIRINGHRIRLFGIDAPESGQSCAADAREYSCGSEATGALSSKIGSSEVSCVQKDVDRYERIVAVCHAGGVDLNGWMVAQGWAVAYRRFSTDYVGEEQRARSELRGIWRGEFTVPAEWRRLRR